MLWQLPAFELYWMEHTYKKEELVVLNNQFQSSLHAQIRRMASALGSSITSRGLTHCGSVQPWPWRYAPKSLLASASLVADLPGAK